MEHYQKPDWFTKHVFNRVVAVFTRLGVSVWGSRDFTARVENAVRSLSGGPEQPDVQGTWIERWQASQPRERRYES